MTIFKNSSDLNIIAEIGVNHEGNLDKAKELLKKAAAAGANYVKFQSYTPMRLTAANDPLRLQRISRFALTQKDFAELAQLAIDENVKFLSTPVTEDWVEFLDPLCSALKIASGDITFKPVITKAAATGKPMILSTGAATLKEIDQAVKWVEQAVGEKNLKDKLILMHCVSAYPTPIEQANVLSIPFLREKYGLQVGYSNHVMGMNACIAAVALGANPIEIHFTDQKEGREFRDHALSFDEQDLRKFIEIAKGIKLSLGTCGKEVQSCELAGIPLMRKGVIAARDLVKGKMINQEDLMFARPATEFSSNDFDKLLGKKLNKEVKKGYLIPLDAI